MRVSRLFVEMELRSGEKLVLDDDAAHYVRTVLRLKKDSAIVLFNGRGGEFQANLIEVGRKQVIAEITQWIDRSVESPLWVEFGLAISRSERMDFAVQKSVELGVNRITPLQTERCVVQLKDEKAEQRRLHWQKIAQHAAEQCGRTSIPEIAPIEDLSSWLGRQSGLKLMLDPLSEKTLMDFSPGDGKVTLLSGPEGGFAQHERELAAALGFNGVKLGERILRTETAALAAIAGVQTLWGDFNR